jgi:hypothetical protein
VITTRDLAGLKQVNQAAMLIKDLLRAKGHCALNRRRIGDAARHILTHINHWQAAFGDLNAPAGCSLIKNGAD